MVKAQIALTRSLLQVGKMIAMQDICYAVFQHWYTLAQCPRRSYFHYSKSFFPIVCQCFVLTSSPLNVTHELHFIIVHFKTTVAWERSLK